MTADGVEELVNLSSLNVAGNMIRRHVCSTTLGEILLLQLAQTLQGIDK